MTTEATILAFAHAALAHFDNGAPEEAIKLLQEAVGILAEGCNVDATELIDVLAYGTNAMTADWRSEAD